MRKLLLSLLLASAAVSPAVADPKDHNDRQAAKAERQQAHEDARAARDDARANRDANRPQLSGGGPQQFARPGGGNAPDHPQFAGRPDRTQFDGERGPRQFDALRADRQARDTAHQQRFDDRDAMREQRQQVIEDRRSNNEALRQSDRPLPPVMHTRVPAPVVSDVPRPGTQPPLRVDNSRSQVSWNTNWRYDGRHDWQDWRRHHHSWFHLGVYYDPFGWGYQPYSVGWRLWPSYYSSSFWINDPWYYRLPYAPPGTRWVRYYNDALLVDMWTGEVIDVVYDFFW